MLIPSSLPPPDAAGQPGAITRHRVEQLANNFKLTPATLYNKIDPAWIPKPFLLHASLKIAKCIAKPNGRLIISWPPRHGKSRLATIATPIWILENFPDKEIILSTYGSDLSTDFGREVRDIFDQNGHILDERIRKDVKSVGRFMTTKGGGMLSVGLGGPIIGKGADVFLIDDYIKTMKEAQSKSKHESDWEWFRGTAYHRLEPGGSMIIIATRWITRDLIGRIMTEFPGEWDHLVFNALAKENDPLGREPGEALFPERYDEEALADKKKVLGSYFFNAIYQQEPDDDESKLTDRSWIEIVDHIPRADRIKWARVWDFAGGGKGSDYSVGTLVGVDMDTHMMIITDITRSQYSPDMIESKVRTLAELDGRNTQVIIEQEPGASGKQLVSHYALNILPEFTVVASPTVTNKVVRAQPVLAAAEHGKVKMLKGPWNETFLDEFEDFPWSDFDDQVDTIAIGYNTLLNKKPTSPVWGRAPKSRSVNRKNPDDNHTGSVIVKGATWGRRRFIRVKTS